MASHNRKDTPVARNNTAGGASGLTDSWRSLFALRRHDAIKAASITHVVSVIRWPIDEGLLRPFKHLQIDVEDVEDENLLEHLPATTQFIENALAVRGNNVIVHW